MAKDQSAKLWDDAWKRYAEASGKDFKDLPRLQSTEELIREVEAHNIKHEDFRKKQSMLFTVLKGAIKPIELVGDLAAGAASTAFPPSSMCFGAVMYFIDAAHGVSASLDAIVELLGQLKEFTVRLKIYEREDLSQELREQLAEILVTVIEIFGQSTKILKEGKWHRLKFFGKNVLTGNDNTMQDLLARLAKLTRSEDLLVGAETLVETKRAARAVNSIQSSMENLTVSTGQILDSVEQSKTQAAAEKDLAHLEAVKKALSPSVLAQDRYDVIRRERAPNSGDWILSEDALQGWVSSKTPILWVSGNPGSGKSFLTYSIITHLHDLDPQNGSHPSVGYFFFRDNKDQTRSFDQALRDVAYQISQTNQAFAKHVSNVTYKNPNATSIRSVWQTLFIDFFVQGVSKGGPTFIVLDGIDESFSEDRTTFFGLLRDLQDAGPASTLHVAMLGRPEIIDEISIELGEGVHTIHIDPIKNGNDIAQYVELSINKSPKLRRYPASLKEEITKTLTSKAGGMFMWVKLMITELNQKSRAASIKEALNAAPRGLNQMLAHVLERFSSSLSEEDADDLNDMLAWVALAKRPLSLGELDAALRLKSADGEGVIYLEGNLRKRFASFFSLSRDDRLTTADLQARKTSLVGEESIDEDVDQDEGFDDVENETDFDSNPTTTKISFSHASISDFFRNPKQGKIKVDGDHPYVGVDLEESKLKIAQTCVNLLVDDSLLTRMRDTISLRPYAKYHWTKHLDDVDLSDVSSEDCISIGTSTARILHEQPLLQKWVGAPNYLFFCSDNAKKLLNWITDEAILGNLTEDTGYWIKSSVQSPIEVFEPAMKCIAERYFISDENYSGAPCLTIIYSYNTRKAGGAVDTLPQLSAEEIERTAEWAGLEQTAEWHRRLAKALQELKCYDAALTHFEKAIAINPGMWLAKSGIGETYVLQKKYQEALEFNEAARILAEADVSADTQTKQKDLGRIYAKTAFCYINLSEAISGSKGNKEEIRLLKLAIEAYKKAFSLDDTYFHCVEQSVEYLKYIVDSLANEDTEEQTARDYQKQVMELMHLLNDTDKGETSNLVKFLHRNIYDDSLTFNTVAWAASGLEQLDWLQSKYLEAIAYAEKNREPVISANLAASLARLYGIFGNDEERAVRLWEAVGTERITSTALASNIGYARTTSLNHLGRYYIGKTLKDELNANKYVMKMERIVAKRRYGARVGTEDSVPPNDVAIYLAAWYHKIGREEEARKLVKPHIRDALMVLSDDDPKNDNEGYWTISHALLALGDDANALAALYAIRKYKDGKAVIEEFPVKMTWANEDARWGCDGLCAGGFPCCDSMIICRYCGSEFEEACHKLVTEGKLPIKICGADHSFLTVPRLLPEQVFKEGELLLEGKIISLEDWKKNIRMKYDG